MKSLPAGLQTMLASGASTLCHCWLLTRTDGVKLGFTDHDLDLTFDGVTYEALAGITAGNINQTDGLNIDTVDVAGALQSDYLNEADLAGGLYDNAALTLYLVDWSDTDNRDVEFAGSIGQVERTLDSFKAEMRGLANALNQTTGRLYSKTCDADLGDARCTVDLTSATFKGNGAVTAATSNANFSASGLDSYADGFFSRGLVTWATGANAGAAMEVKLHVNDGTVSFSLWESMAYDIGVGDTFAVTAGCDKSAQTCKSKFDNVANFRGFPFIPGNDALTSYPVATSVTDGGTRDGSIG